MSDAGGGPAGPAGGPEGGAAGADRLATFGRWLERERELRGLTRDEVTRATRLAPGVVEALEGGDRARLPPRAYAVGYLRAVAAAEALDADEVVLRWEEAIADTPAPGARPATPVRWLVLGAVALLAAGAAALLMLR